MDKIRRSAWLSLLFNILFGGYHVISGILTHSPWLLTVGVYYAILSVVRFFAIRSRKNDRAISKITGVLLMVAALPLMGMVILTSVQSHGAEHHQIIMIAMAAYAFTKITLATVNLVKSQKTFSIKHVTLRSISFSDALVSIFSLQRSMLVSFGDMPETNVRLFNVLTGSGVCILVFLLGLTLVRSRRHLPPS